MGAQPPNNEITPSTWLSNPIILTFFPPNITKYLGLAFLLPQPIYPTVQINPFKTALKISRLNIREILTKISL